MTVEGAQGEQKEKTELDNSPLVLAGVSSTPGDVHEEAMREGWPEMPQGKTIKEGE